jgi:hypothetical protein
VPSEDRGWTGPDQRRNIDAGAAKLMTVFETFEDEAAAVRSFAYRPGT